MPPCIKGQHGTRLTPLPSLNVSTCNATTLACFFRYPNVTDAVQPNFSILSDFDIYSLGWPLTGNFSTYSWIVANRVTSYNVWLWGLGEIGTTAPDYGITMNGPNYFHALTVFNTGTVSGCHVIGTGATSAGINAVNTMEQSYCKGGVHSLQIDTNAALRSFGGQFDRPNGGSAAEVITNDGIFDSYAEHIFPAGGVAATIKTTANGKTYLHGNMVLGQTSNTGGALGCATSGGKVMVENSNIDGGTGGAAVVSVAGCDVINLGNNNFVQGTFSLSGNNFSVPTETQTGTCAANAATVTFIRAYQIAPRVQLTPTTSGSTGAQATATTTTTATIHCNGATDAFVATVYPNPF